MEALLFSSSPSKPFVQMFAGLGNAVEKKDDIVANATQKTGSSVPFEKGDLCHERDGVGRARCYALLVRSRSMFRLLRCLVALNLAF